VKPIVPAALAPRAAPERGVVQQRAATFTVSARRARGPAPVGPPGPGRAPVVQRTTASVDFDGKQAGTGSRSKGGTGGVNHAEQLAWADAKDKFDNFLSKGDEPVVLRFDVDQKVCGPCQAWFANTLWPAVQQKAKHYGRTVMVMISVDTGKTGTYGSMSYNGPGTIWASLVAE